MVKVAERPPAFLSKASLARELDCAESTIDELVRRGILPKPTKLTSGMVRWSWASVEMALISIQGGGTEPADPFMAAVERYKASDDGKTKGKKRD